MANRKRFLASCLIGATALLAGASCALATSTPAAFAPTSVSVATADGGEIHADLYGRGSRAVILAPGGRFDKASWRTQAQALARAGFRVMAIDFRALEALRAGHDSACVYDTHCLARDVMAAVRYLHRSGASTVALVGASLGGGAAAQAAIDSDPGEIDRVVLLAHMRVDHPELLKARSLFIVARDDVEGEGTPRLPGIREQFDRAPEPKRLLVLEGQAHAQFLFETGEGERVMREMLAFLQAP